MSKPSGWTGLLLLSTLLLFHLLVLDIVLVPASPRQETPSQPDDKAVLKDKIADLAEQVKGRDEELSLRRATIAKQRYMLASLVLLASLLLAFLAVLRVRESAKRKGLRLELIRSQQQALSLQMNPHFIFNTLGSLQSFILTNDRDSSNLYLTKFSRLMRVILHNVERELVDLDEEVEALRLYLELQHMRFGDHFGYDVRIDPCLDLTSVPVAPFLIQPYVENAIRHGLLPGERRGRLTVEVKALGPDVLCVIEDDGVGRGTAARLRSGKGRDARLHGTEIASRRIDLLNHLDPERYSVTTCDLEDDGGNAAGTRVEILLKGRAG